MLHKMRITIEAEYVANPGDYDTDDAARMAEIDASNIGGDPFALAEFLEGLPDGFKVKIEPMTEQA